VIIGAGFGGLYAAKALGKIPVSVTVLDRKNHHTFQPLLYQVATAGLSPGDIAVPIRSVLRKYKNIEVLMGEAVGFDLERKIVKFREVEVNYDYLIVATGATHSYFAHPEWEQWAPGLKTVEDATDIRRRILLAFENAEREAALLPQQGSVASDFALAPGHRATAIAGSSPMQKGEPLNFVIVGAGPTGVELAGAIAEISRRVLRHDFRLIDPTKARVILLEGAPRVLQTYPEDLSRKAEKQLKKLGVEVRTGAVVTEVGRHVVMVGDEKIEAAVVLWAAGVKASPLAKALDAAYKAASHAQSTEPALLDRAGRVKVAPDCSVPGHPEIFVIGDLAALNGTDGKALPGLAPVAMQMGRAVAANIGRDLKHQPRKPFHYLDKGTMATIGRAAAVGMTGKMHFSGFVAWFAWLFIHILYLIGFRNRLMVLLEWAWAYLRFEKAARLITGDQLPQ